MTRPPLGIATRLFYGVGSVAYGVKDNGFSFFLLLYYNQVLGLPEEWVAAGIMVTLLVDAFSDPIVGYFSDNFRSRWGRRHPLMYAAALPVAASYFLLWSPPAGLSPPALLAYLVVVAIGVRTLVDFYEVPSSALVAELTDDYHERTKLLSFRYSFGWWGGLTMAVLAYAVFLQPDSTHSVGVLNPDGYRRYGLAASCIMLGAILVSALGTHRYIPYLRQPPARRQIGLGGALREMRETLTSRSFVALLCAGVFLAAAAGMTAALNIYFNTFFWQLTSDQIALLVLPNFVSAVLAFALAPRVSRRLGKRRAVIVVALGALFFGPLPVVLRLLGLFPPNGSPALIPTLMVANTVTVTLFIAASILISSMVADIVEESELTTGRRSEGLFFAGATLVQKASSGLGVLIAGLLLRAIDFPRQAKPADVDPAVVQSLGLVYAPVIVGLYLVGILFLSTYRIDESTHAANVETLRRRSVG